MSEMSVYDFGRSLIETSDLDPVYTLVHAAQLEGEPLANWLLAYWCCYHMGTSSWIVDQGKTQEDYWEALADVASSSEHPRGTERRHFRGKASKTAVIELRRHALSPSELVVGFLRPKKSEGLRMPLPSSSNGVPRLSSVMNRVKLLRGFGDWIAFKVADMLERLEVGDIDFRPSDVFSMFKTPREGAEELGRWEGKTGPGVYLWAYNRLIRELGTLSAPPRFERPINIQEVETILCKWKSHLGGHYPLGKDTVEIRHALERYKTSPTAASLLQAGFSCGLYKD